MDASVSHRGQARHGVGWGGCFPSNWQGGQHNQACLSLPGGVIVEERRVFLGKVGEGNNGDTKQLARMGEGRSREQKKTSFVEFSFAAPSQFQLCQRQPRVCPSRWENRS